MNRKVDWIEKRHALRRAADSVLTSVSRVDATAQPMDVMVHELLVHKVELEMQVEELQRAHTAMEAARDHYLEYYEFAPVGYFAVNRDGVISEINLTGAAMLGLDRADLIYRRMAHFIAPQDRDRWHRLIPSMLEPVTIARPVFMLEMLRANGAPFDAYFDCRTREPMTVPPMLRFALFDAGKFRQAEEAKAVTAACTESA